MLAERLADFVVNEIVPVFSKGTAVPCVRLKTEGAPRLSNWIVLFKEESKSTPEMLTLEKAVLGAPSVTTKLFCVVGLVIV